MLIFAAVGEGRLHALFLLWAWVGGVGGRGSRVCGRELRVCDRH